MAFFKKVKARFLIDKLSYSNKDVRKNAVENLVRIGEPAVEPLLKALRDSSPSVRRNAIVALGIIRDHRAVEPIINCLGDSYPAIKNTAISVLEDIGDPRAIEPIIKCLGDEDPSVRKTAILVFEKTGNPRAIEPIIKCLGDEDLAIKKIAISLLGKIGGRQAIAALQDFWREQDLSPGSLRIAASDAIRQIAPGIDAGRVKESRSPLQHEIWIPKLHGFGPNAGTEEDSRRDVDDAEMDKESE